MAWMETCTHSIHEINIMLKSNVPYPSQGEGIFSGKGGGVAMEGVHSHNNFICQGDQMTKRMSDKEEVNTRQKLKPLRRVRG